MVIFLGYCRELFGKFDWTESKGLMCSEMKSALNTLVEKSGNQLCHHHGALDSYWEPSGDFFNDYLGTVVGIIDGGGDCVNRSMVEIHGWLNDVLEMIFVHNLKGVRPMKLVDGQFVFGKVFGEDFKPVEMAVDKKVVSERMGVVEKVKEIEGFAVDELCRKWNI